MAKEIERKWLIPPSFELEAMAMMMSIGTTSIVQGYLHASASRVVRVRRSQSSFENGCESQLTVKISTSDMSVRDEFEYSISDDEAIAMLSSCTEAPICKTRYTFDLGGGQFLELDFFKGLLEGLVLAEIELSEVGERVELPPWLEKAGAKEVTNDVTYLNSNLLGKTYDHLSGKEGNRRKESVAGSSARKS